MGSKAAQLLAARTLQRILETAALHLRHLRHVEISTPIINNADMVISGSTVTLVLQHCCTLEMLVLWPLVKLDSVDLVHGLANVLRENAPKLQTFSLLNLVLEETRQEPNNNSDTSAAVAPIVLDSILQALSGIPSLLHVHLSPCVRTDKERCLIAQPTQVLSNLLSSTTSNTSHCRLQSLSLRNMGLVDESFGIPFAGALRQNRTLQHVDVRFNALGSATHAALHDTLKQDNMTITSLSLDNTRIDDNAHKGKNNETISKIDLLVRMNAAGRRVLQEGGPLSACLDSFAAASHDTNVMFLLLKASPQLFVC